MDKRLLVDVSVCILLLKWRLIFNEGFKIEIFLLVVLFFILKIGFMDGFLSVNIIFLLFFLNFWVKLMESVVLFLLLDVGLIDVIRISLLGVLFFNFFCKFNFNLNLFLL